VIPLDTRRKFFQHRYMAKQRGILPVRAAWQRRKQAASNEIGVSP
jgi:hypothetical protein